MIEIVPNRKSIILRTKISFLGRKIGTGGCDYVIKDAFPGQESILYSLISAAGNNFLITFRIVRVSFGVCEIIPPVPQTLMIQRYTRDQPDPIRVTTQLHT